MRFLTCPAKPEQVSAAGAAGKPVVLLNANLGDIQSSSGVMGVRNRQGHGAVRGGGAAVGCMRAHSPSV